MAKDWPFTLDMLPLQGITSPVANIEFIRGRLVNTLSILDGVLKMPSGLPGDLKQMVYNIRFHVVAGIGLVDAGIRSGLSWLELAASVDGLPATIDNHIAALRETLPAWRHWLRAARKQQSSPGAVGFGMEPALPAPLRSEFMRQLAQPVRTGDYVGAGLASAGLYGLSRVPHFRGYGEGMVNLPPNIGTGLEKVAPNIFPPKPATVSSLVMLGLVGGFAWAMLKKR